MIGNKPNTLRSAVQCTCFIILALVLAAHEARGQCTNTEAFTAPSNARSSGRDLGPAMGLQAEIDKLEVTEVASDHIQFAVSFSLLYDRDASIRQLYFDNMRLNDTPFYAAPIQERLKLIANHRLVLPHPVEVKLYYRDLESLQPLEQVVRDGRVRAQGTMYADLDLNLFEKTILLARRVRVPVSFQKDSPVVLPGNGVGRAAALTVLATASKEVEKVTAAVASVSSKTSLWRQELTKNYASALLLTNTQFVLKNHGGGKYLVDCAGTGFRINANQFLVTKEAVEPWKFDPDIATAIQLAELKLDAGSVDLTVWPSEALLRTPMGALDLSTGFQQSKKQFKLVTMPKDQYDTFFTSQVSGRPHKIHLVRRESATNLALFEFAGSTTISPLLPIKTDKDSTETSWERVAVFRFPAGINAKQAHPDLVFLAATRDGTTIRMTTPIDYSGWGAPLVLPLGIVGIVQSEGTALDLKQVFQVLRVDSDPPNPGRVQ